MAFGTYDAATGVLQMQTREQFYDSLTADIQRALDAAAAPKSLREIQAEEAAAAAATKKKAADDAARAKRVAAEKAAAEAAWESDWAARNASGMEPCPLCEQFAKKTRFHAPKQGACPLVGRQTTKPVDSELGGLIDAALTSKGAAPAKAGKKGKKQTVERFQLDTV